MKKQKVLTCTGYYCSGSSAITDLLIECDNINCAGDYEVRFLFDPYGVSDLEYQIVHMPNRHNSSHAVNRFLYHMKFLAGVGPIKRYEKYFKGHFWEETQKYVSSLVDFSYRSRWHFDIYERGKLYYVMQRSIQQISAKILKIFTGNPYAHAIHLTKHDVAYCVHPSEEEFLDATKNYINQLMTIINPAGKEYVMCDQLLPSSNIGHYMRYFDDIKVVVVDRDPRDVYIYTTIVENGTIVPRDVEQFCKWFKWTRSMTDKDRGNPNILFVQLEDLIFHYEEEKNKVLEFIGIESEHHRDKKKYFNPEISKLRTKFWLKYPEKEREIKYIEQELSDYLYDFDKEN